MNENELGNAYLLAAGTGDWGAGGDVAVQTVPAVGVTTRQEARLLKQLQADTAGQLLLHVVTTSHVAHHSLPQTRAVYNMFCTALHRHRATMSTSNRGLGQ